MTKRQIHRPHTDVLPTTTVGKVEAHLAFGRSIPFICAAEGVPAKFVELVSLRLEAIDLDLNVDGIDKRLRECIRAHPAGGGR